jgi:hypothetical protein
MRNPSLVLAAIALSVSALSASTVAQAQTFTGVQVDRPTAKPGEPVSVTASFNEVDSPNCGMHISWGDGAGDDFKIIEATNMPLKASHTYAQPGDYTITAEPKKVTTRLGCIGNKRTAMVKVVAPPVAARPAAPMAAPGAAPAAIKVELCPQGWSLNAKSMNKKTGAYSCTAKANTPVTGAKTNCPGDLTYFENTKKGQLGCRP